MRLSVNDQPVSQHSFPQGAELLGHTLAALVPKGCQDFNPVEQEFLEPELCSQTSCSCGHTTARPGRPDPVAQIRQPVLGPKFIQADTANKCPAGRMEDPKVKLAPIIPLLSGPQNPFQTLFHGIVTMAPGKPNRNFCRGFASSLEEQGTSTASYRRIVIWPIGKRSSHTFVVSMMGCNNPCLLVSLAKHCRHACRPTVEDMRSSSCIR